jgi:cyclic pyranopterin phosphate synthase
MTEEGLRSIPDWLLKGAAMRVPCDAYQMIWVGADGTVQLCYVTFRLGNLHEKPLTDLLFTAAHRQAARSAFALDCPNCHCHYDRRIRKHAPSLQRFTNNGQ